MATFDSTSDTWFFMTLDMSENAVYVWTEFGGSTVKRFWSFIQKFRQFALSVKFRRRFDPLPPSRLFSVTPCDTGILTLAIAKEDAIQQQWLADGILATAGFRGAVIETL